MSRIMASFPHGVQVADSTKSGGFSLKNHVVSDMPIAMVSLCLTPAQDSSGKSIKVEFDAKSQFADWFASRNVQFSNHIKTLLSEYAAENGKDTRNVRVTDLGRTFHHAHYKVEGLSLPEVAEALSNPKFLAVDAEQRTRLVEAAKMVDEQYELVNRGNRSSTPWINFENTQQWLADAAEFQARNTKGRGR